MIANMSFAQGNADIFFLMSESMVDADESLVSGLDGSNDERRRRYIFGRADPHQSTTTKDPLFYILIQSSTRRNHKFLHLCPDWNCLEIAGGNNLSSC